MSGTLYVCGTPIGNLEDSSIRLLKTLRRVDLIACEDTRHTVKLLNHFKIRKKLFSYHEHSQSHREQFLLDQLAEGLSIALVSDAGMPLISDPGQGLVQRALEAGIAVEVIPGPTAFTAALVLSGLDSTSFTFVGFLPAKRGPRQAMLQELKEEHRTLIFYEAPHRLLKTLEDMQAVMGAAHPVAVVREITKIHEEVRRGSIAEILQYYQENQPRGEICVLLPAASPIAGSVPMEQIIAETAALIDRGMDKKEAFKVKAREYNVKKSTIYKHFMDN